MTRRRHTARLLGLLAVLGVLACDRVTPVAPAGSTITISVNPSRIAAEEETALVTIIVRREDGTPVNPGTQVNISTTLGTLEPEVAFTDETGVAKSNLTGDGRIGMATVSATTGAAPLMSVEVQIGSVAASITLTASKTDVSKDPPPEGEVINLLALVRDDTGAPLGGSTVNFDAGTGSLDSGGAALVTNDSGEARDTLTISRDNLAILTEAFFEITAETAGEGGALIFDVVEIFIRDVPATITLQATPAAVADVGGSTVLSAIVRDGLGDGLPGAGVNFLTDLGTLSSGGSIITTDNQGQARDTLTLTEDDISTLGSATTFNVRVQTAGLAGSLLEDTFQIRIASCRPIATFTCRQPNAGDLQVYTFDWTQSDPTGLTFDWKLRRNLTGVAEATASTQSVTHRFDFTDVYTVELSVTDPACGAGGATSFSSIEVDPPSACP